MNTIMKETARIGIWMRNAQRLEENTRFVRNGASVEQDDTRDSTYQLIESLMKPPRNGETISAHFALLPTTYSPRGPPNPEPRPNRTLASPWYSPLLFLWGYETQKPSRSRDECSQRYQIRYGHARDCTSGLSKQRSNRLKPATCLPVMMPPPPIPLEYK